MRILLTVGLLLALLPLLAIGRGVAGVFERASQYGALEWAGLCFAFTAFLMGSIFFAYSVKYYLGTLIVLLSCAGRSPADRGATGDRPTSALPRIQHRGAESGQITDDTALDAGVQPFVSIHIATYNEKRVIERLLDACARLDYANYEVIVVDDSTDESWQILQRWSQVQRFKIVHRPGREGFKGGALREALRWTDPRAEYIVVFDADAVPFADSIKRFLPHFYRGTTNGQGLMKPRDEVGAVQSYQWHVLNKSENWLTQAVRTEYSGSYMVERPFQQAVGSMKMVAGTAYMVRAHLLHSLGWGSSLTEDWELTIRLYLKGYKVVYTPYVETPAECVSTFPRLARQRMRWAEGHTHNVRKWFAAVVTSPRITVREKLEFVFYSTYYLQALFFAVGTTSWLVAELVFKVRIPEWSALLGWSLLFSNLLSLPAMNLAGLLLEAAPAKDAGGILGAIATSYLLVPFQAWAAVKGLIEKEEGPWFRTPKTGRITDPVWPLRRLQQLRRWLWGPKPRPLRFEPAGIAVASHPRPSRRLGWVVIAALLLALGGLAVGAVRAPVVYANPDQLFLRNNVSAFNGADEELDVQGTAGAARNFRNGNFFTWLTQTTYANGSNVPAGNYTFNFDFGNNSCAPCTITVTWGFCNGTCATLQAAAVTFTFTLNTGDPVSGSKTSTTAGTAVTTSGCPCKFYVQLANAAPSGDFDLEYNGNTNNVNNTNIVTPTIAVPELGLAVVGIALLAPWVARRRSRRLVTRWE